MKCAACEMYKIQGSVLREEVLKLKIQLNLASPPKKRWPEDYDLHG